MKKFGGEFETAPLGMERESRFNPRVAIHGAYLACIIGGHAMAFKDDPEGDPPTAPAVKELAGKIETTMEGFKGLLEKQEGEIKQYGETTAETAKKISQAEKDLGEMGAELKELQRGFTDLEKRLGRKGALGGFGEGRQETKSPGELFTASEEYKAFLANQGAKQTGAVVFGSTFGFNEKGERGGREFKTLSSDPASAGDVVRAQRIAEIFAPPLRAPRLRDLMMVSPTSSNAIEYIEETELHQLQTVLTATEPAAETVMAVENTVGFYAGQAITVNGESHTIASVDHDANTITLNAGLAAEATSGSEVNSTTFEATPETKLKPNFNIKFDLKTVNVKTLAHGMPMTRQILEDAPRLRSHVNNRGLEGLKLVEEDHILYGDGSSNQLQGIMTHGDVPSYSWSSGSTGDTKYDAIRRAMTVARLAEYPVSGVVLHPDDVEDLETIKGSDGHYLNIAMMIGNQRQVWRVPFVETTAINSGEFLVGAFNMGAELFDRMQAMVRIAEEHKDFFMRNMLQLLIEERIAMAIYRPQAFVKGTFDAAPA